MLHHGPELLSRVSRPPNGHRPEAPPHPIKFVRRLCDSLERAFAARLLYNDPAHPAYLTTLERLRTNLEEALNVAPDGLFLRLEGGRVLWRGSVAVGGSRPSRLYTALSRNGVSEVDFVAPAAWGEVARMIEFLHEHAAATDPAEGALGLEEIGFLRLKRGNRGRHIEGCSPTRGAGVTTGPASEGLVSVEESLDSGPFGDGEDEGSGEGGAVRGGDEDGAGHVIDHEDRLALAEMIRAETERDAEHDVATALLDVFDAREGRWRDEVLQHLPRLLDVALAEGRVPLALYVLRELRVAAATHGHLEGERVDRAVAGLAEGSGLHALATLLTEGHRSVDPSALGDLLALLAPGSFLAALRIGVLCANRAVRSQAFAAAEAIASERPAILLEGLDPAEEAQTIKTALRLATRLRLHADGTSDALSTLIEDERPNVRVAAIDACARLGSPKVLDELSSLLEAPERDVRIAAARALGRARYRPARARFAQLVAGARIRRADVTEKRAVFEAYGRVAGPRDIELLGRLLHGRRFLLLTEPADLRGCAALALGNASTNAALGALLRARNASHPIVRTAVRNALSAAESQLSA